MQYNYNWSFFSDKEKTIKNQTTFTINDVIQIAPINGYNEFLVNELKIITIIEKSANIPTAKKMLLQISLHLLLINK